MTYFTNVPEKFDPSNTRHLKAYKTYIKTGKHDPDIRFILEFPHLSLPHMLHQKVAEHHLNYVLEKENQISKLNEVKMVAMTILTRLKRAKTTKMTLETVESLLESILVNKT